MLKNIVFAFASLALAFTLVSAHGGVLWYKIGSTWYQGFVPYNTPTGQSSIQREWDTYDPITDPTSSGLSCNFNGAVLAAQKSATVAAGTSIGAYWNTWPHSIGPVLVYMAKCSGSCSSATPSSLSWFKIAHAGLISGTLTTGTWAQGQLIANNNSWTTTIPSSLAAGEYFIRHELIALHTSNQPQFYPECAQLVVTGGGGATPSGSYLVKFPGAYKASDPGITIDIYAHQTQTNYTIPGPAVWSG